MDKKVTLRVSFVEPEFQEAWDKKIKPEFEAEYPGIELESVVTGMDDLRYHLKHLTDGQFPEILQVDALRIYYKLAEAGRLLDVRKYHCTKDVAPEYLDSLTYKDVCFGIPEGNAYVTLYVNMALLAEAGWTKAPENWEEFTRCCEDIRNKTGAAPLAMPTGKDAQATTWASFEAILLNTYREELEDGRYDQLARSGEIDFTEYPEAAAKMTELAGFLAPGCDGASETEIAGFLKDGKCAMAIAGSWVCAMMVDAITEANGGDASMVRMVPLCFNKPETKLLQAAIVESGIGVSEVSDPELSKARDLFYEWIFMPEHYAYIQNGMGNFPILNSMTEDQIRLSQAAIEFKDLVKNADPFYIGSLRYAAAPYRQGAELLGQVYAGKADASETMEKLNRVVRAETWFREMDEEE